ncbi:MAG: cytochrome c biogenesis heme-transporting ATPase CcmA [Pseudomonadota bacterium]
MESGALLSALSLSLRNISVFRGDRCLLRDLGLDIAAADVVHLVGPNGCGKTSLMRIIAGLTSPETGEVLWQGRPISQQRSAYLRNCAWLGHTAGLKGDMTLLENLRFDNRLRRNVSDQLVVDTLRTLGIDNRADVAARGLSAGQRRRAALARVLLSDACLWLLDEPFTNLDREGQQEVRALMAAHARAGGAIVFAAHHDVAIEGVTVRRLEWGQQDAG